MRVTRQPRLIIFDKVTKFSQEYDPPTMLFGQLSFTLPTDRRIAIIGRKETGRTTMLKLLGGETKPDVGRIVTKDRFSMILNDRTYLHPRMTILENAESLARMYNLDKEKLWKLAVCLPGIKPAIWSETIKELDPRDRRSVEMLLASILPFDCYLADDIEKADQNVLATAVRMAAARQAGFIFTTYSLKVARQYADCVGIIANQNLYLFDSLKEAEKFYER